jgi:cytochrome c
MKAFWLSVTVAAILFSAGNTFSATPKEAAAVVRAVSAVTNAVQFYQENGKEKALAEFNNPRGRFNYVELYIFAYDMTGTVIAESRNKRLVGMHLINLPDADGKFYIEAIVDMAKWRGKGSVEYSFENPDTDTVEPRRVYFQRVDDVIICCVIPASAE